MSNTFTKTYQDGPALTEAELDTAFQSVQPSQDNLALATFDSASGHILQSAGSNVAPVWVSASDAIEDSTISAAAAKKVIDAATSSTSPSIGLSNNIINNYTRTTGSSVTNRGVAISTSVSTSNNTTAFADASGLNLEITTNGRPVWVGLSGNSTSSPSGILVASGSAADDEKLIAGEFRVLRGTSVATASNIVGTFALDTQITLSSTNMTTFYIRMPPSSLWSIDVPAAGTYFYKVQMRVAPAGSVNTDRAEVANVKLVAYEL